jgi:sugar/nucleoside kinase (ribokinase family)
MSLLVTGSVALDTLETPYGKLSDTPGGSATYFAISASRLVPVLLVGIAGRDFPRSYLSKLRSIGIDTSGLMVRTFPTFRWHGRYKGDMSQAETVSVTVETFEKFAPSLTQKQKNSRYIFLANCHPRIQLSVLEQIENPKLVFCDTMNIWIQTELDLLKKLLKRADGLILNKDEAQMLTGTSHWVETIKKLHKFGPRIIIVKKGEHGALLSYEGHLRFAPSYPVEKIKDPTGAGDSFAGGVMGYIAGKDSTDRRTINESIYYGTVMASFCIEELGQAGLFSSNKKTIADRLKLIRTISGATNTSSSSA